MRIAIATGLLFLLMLPGCDSREERASPPVRRDIDSLPDAMPASRAPTSTLPESNPVPSSENALKRARGLAAGDPWAALAAYDDAFATFQAELVPWNDDRLRSSHGVLYLYKEGLAEADELVRKIETPEYDAKVPQRDLLSNEERTCWKKTAGVDLVFGRGVEIRGVEATGAKVHGVASIDPDKTSRWHDVEVDLEFTILAGGFELYLRYVPGAKPYPIWFSPGLPPPERSPSDGPTWGWVGPRECENYKLLAKHRVTVSVKGNSIRMVQPGLPEGRDLTDVDASRTGGIGFAVQPESRLLITSFKLKVLR